MIFSKDPAYIEGYVPAILERSPELTEEYISAASSICIFTYKGILQGHLIAEESGSLVVNSESSAIRNTLVKYHFSKGA